MRSGRRSVGRWTDDLVEARGTCWLQDAQDIDEATHGRLSAEMMLMISSDTLYVQSVELH